MRKRIAGTALALIMLFGLFPAGALAASLETAADMSLEYDFMDSFSDGLEKVETDGKCGYVDTTGKLVIPLKYDYADFFYEGYAQVRLNDKWGIIDKTGKEVVPLEYSAMYPLHEGCAVAYKNGKVGLVNTSGKLMAYGMYEYIEADDDGLWYVIKDNKIGFIDKTGTLLIPLKYDYAEALGQGVIDVRLDGKHGLINTSGNVVLPLEYDDMIGLSDNGLASVDKNGKSGFADTAGNIVVPLIYDEVSNFINGFALVRSGELWGMIDATGNVVIPLEYETLRDFSDGVALAKIPYGEKGFVDISGNFTPLYDYDVDFFSEGFALFSEGYKGKYGYIDKTGTLVIPAEYDLAYSFENGLARVQKNGYWGYINKAGKAVVPIVYDQADYFTGGFARVMKDGKYGLVDTSGNLVLPVAYDVVVHVDFGIYDEDGYIPVKKDGKWGIFHINNTVSAAQTVSPVIIDGQLIGFDAYNINGNNFFKLRDLAIVLSGSAKQFQVSWDGANNAIVLTSNTPYTAVGGELEYKGEGATKTAVETDSKILLDGKEIYLTAYNIEGNNYFKLRDIGELFDFEVDWDGVNNRIIVDTGKSYTPD